MSGEKYCKIMENPILTAHGSPSIADKNHGMVTMSHGWSWKMLHKTGEILGFSEIWSKIYQNVNCTSN